MGREKQKPKEITEDERLCLLRELFHEREQIVKEICELFEVLKTKRTVKFPDEHNDGSSCRKPPEVRQACEEICKLENLLIRISQLVERLIDDHCDMAAIEAEEAERELYMAKCDWQAEQRPRRIVKVAAIIARVYPKSPAYKSNLRAGDYIIMFGPINPYTYDGNAETFNCVAEQSIGCSIKMKILRNGHIIKKKIKPRYWRGCGLLGFTIDHCNMEQPAML